jgi:two-component sensor histidine kinase
MPKFPEEAMRASPLLNGLLALVTGLGAVPCTAQEAVPTTALPVEWITVDDGLPQGMVRAILQDRTGYLWFATKDGLARSDGYGYTVFRHDPGDSTSISANHISALYEDRAGDLWIGTDAGAVDRYEPRTGAFVHMGRSDPTTPGISQAVRQFAEDGHGNMLVFATDGIVTRRTKDGTAKRVAEHITAMAVAPNGALWTLTSDVLEISAQRDVGSGAHVKRIALPTWSGVGALIADTVGQRMIMVRDRSVVFIDPVTHVTSDTMAIHAVGGELATYFLDGDKLWLGFIGDAQATRLSLTDGSEERIAFTEVNGGSLPGESLVSAFAKDRSGNLWVGTRGYGVLLHRALAGRFHRLLQGSSPWLVKADREGRWVVASSELLWVNAPDGEVRPIAFKEALRTTGRGPSWFAIQRDDQGAWWACVTLTNNTLMRHGPAESDGLHAVPLGTQEDPLMLITCDSPDLWILASASPGKPADRILRFDPAAQRIIARYVLPFPLLETDYRAVSALHFGSDGSLWLGTRQGVLEWRSEQWTVHKPVPGDVNTLPSERIFSLCPDPDSAHGAVGGNGGRRAGADGHAHRALPHLRREHRPAEQRGLRDPRRCAPQPLDQHQRWPLSLRSTHARRAHLFAQRRHSRYRVQPVQRSDRARRTFLFRWHQRHHLVRSQHHVWRCGAFRHGDHQPRTGQTPRALEHIRSHGGQALRHPIAARSPHHAFAALRRALAHHLLRVHGPLRAAEEPLPLPARGLPHQLGGCGYRTPGHLHQPGSGHLHLPRARPQQRRCVGRARRIAGTGDRTAVVGHLVVPRCGAAVLLGSGLYAFYRYRLAQAMKVVAVRERIARDLHDEIGSTLSSVSLYSSVAQKKVAQKAPEANELLARISESTTQVLESINDIVWAVNADNDDMEHVVKRMIDHAVRMTETRECQLHFDHDPALRALPLDMSARKNLYLVFKEAVNNAVKYSGCTELRVTLLRERGQIVLRIADDGRGFDPQHVQSTSGGGNGLPNMRKRAAELGATLTITSAMGEGTAIELRFVPDGPANRRAQNHWTQ